MRYVKWTFWGTILLIVLSFAHYTLPQHDIVRIVGTNTQRMDLGENSWFFAAPDVGTDGTISNSRDVKFIQAIQQDGDPMVYRNEDTGWGWPPYFKVNSFDVQAAATDLTSTEASPKWVAITHYGWRNQLFTIFPNAVSVRQVAGPDVSIWPWFNTLFIALVAFLLLMLRRMWLQFRERTIEPAMDDVNNALDAVDASADAARDKARGLWSRLTGRGK
ncbi:DUF1523 family protein [Rhodobacter ferrooxidans]|uniref:DUF1523 domain-containing protein n=1 Tax=Rhodobacter ferrooxidans TaxID=371731 RepID=C8S2X1_9RHOB|nr:DUF1523 family protein [Rhodobacter sp. SW2]EEW24611.1 protein of unknown function DUF1523 [Rhodobacter sp. SW2]